MGVHQPCHHVAEQYAGPGNDLQVSPPFAIDGSAYPFSNP